MKLRNYDKLLQILLGNVLSGICVWLSISVLSKNLPQNIFSNITYYNEIILFYITIIDTGLNIWYVRNFTNKNKSRINSNYIIVKLIYLFFVFLFLVVLNDFAKEDVLAFLIISSSSLVLTYGSLYQAQKKFLKYSIFKCTNAFVKLCTFGISILLLSHSFINIFSVYFYGTLLFFVFCFLFLENIEFKMIELSYNVIVNIIKTSCILGAAGIGAAIISRVDLVMLNKYNLISDVAVYSVSQSYSRIVSIINVAFSVYLLSEVSDISFDKSASFIKKKIILMAPIYISILILSYLILPIVIKYVNGDIYFSKSYCAIFLIFVLTIEAFFLPVIYVLIRFGKEHDILIQSLIMVLSNIVLNLLLIREYHINGVLIGTLCSKIISMLYLYYKYKKIKMIESDFR